MVMLPIESLTFNSSQYIPIAGYQLDMIIILLSIIAGCELTKTISMLGEWAVKSLGVRRR